MLVPSLGVTVSQILQASSLGFVIPLTLKMRLIAPALSTLHSVMKTH